MCLISHAVRSIINLSDRKRPVDTNTDGTAEYYEPTILTASDYYAFGMDMPNRTFNAGDYRFGFNGKEADRDGGWGSLNHYDYGFRIYNPGIARFLRVDPLRREYPWYTPYQFAGNSPIRFIDLDGLEPTLPGNKNFGYAVALDNASGKPFAWNWINNTWARGNPAFLAGNPEPDGSSDLQTISNPSGESKYIRNEGQRLANTYFKGGIEYDHLTTFVGAFKLATILGETKDEDVLVDNFLKGNGSPVQFGSNTGLSRNISKVNNFKEFANNFEKAALSYFRENGSLEGFDGTGFIRRRENQLRYLGSFDYAYEIFSYAVLGGFNAVGIEVLDINKDIISTRYTITDHFGGSIDDSYRTNLPGLPNLYFLQHYLSNGRSRLGNTYQPFIWNTIIERRGNGTGQVREQRKRQPFIDIRKL